MNEDTTQLLTALSQGDESVLERLLPRVYDDLKAIAAGQMRRESRDHTLSPTALVNEAYLKLMNQTRTDWKSRTHFCAIAAKLMRRVLVDHARQRRAAKRQGSAVLVPLNEELAAGCESVDIIALDELLEGLSDLNPRHTRVVELRFFGGLTIEETAHALSVSVSTVKDDWRVARAWLLSQLQQ